MRQRSLPIEEEGQDWGRGGASGVERVVRSNGRETPEVPVGSVNRSAVGLRQRRNLGIRDQISSGRGRLFQEEKRTLQMIGARQ